MPADAAVRLLELTTALETPGTNSLRAHYARTQFMLEAPELIRQVLAQLAAHQAHHRALAARLR